MLAQYVFLKYLARLLNLYVGKAECSSAIPGHGRGINAIQQYWLGWIVVITAVRSRVAATCSKNLFSFFFLWRFVTSLMIFLYLIANMMTYSIGRTIARLGTFGNGKEINGTKRQWDMLKGSGLVDCRISLYHHYEQETWTRLIVCM